ncbi:MAG: DNA cytosine methyltransferase [Pseudomonadota bacterium]
MSVKRTRFSFLEFFAGGGMARIGLGPHWDCAFANDVDARKCDAYRTNFGGEELVEASVEALSLRDLPNERADLAWASFPCQDLSLAGMRGGIEAKRSGAFFGFWRLIEALDDEGRAPHMIVLENVPGLITSNAGADLDAIAQLMRERGYRPLAGLIDARAFTPQSRPRLFVVGLGPGVHKAPVADGSSSNESSADAAFQRAGMTAFPSPRQIRNTRLSDLVEMESHAWDPASKTQDLVAMMGWHQRARLDALLRSGARRVGAGFRRTRIIDGKKVQRFEARFDGLAGCLRTPAGGSSRQIIIAVEGGAVRTRLMAPREAARLMGLDDDYLLPDSRSAALKLCGDGVCAPAVRWLAETILEPALSHRRRARAA